MKYIFKHVAILENIFGQKLFFKKALQIPVSSP